MKALTNYLSLLTLTAALAACGGGGSDSADSSGNTDQMNDESVSMDSEETLKKRIDFNSLVIDIVQNQRPNDEAVQLNNFSVEFTNDNEDAFTILF